MAKWTKEGWSNGPVGHPWSFWTGGPHSGTLRNMLEHFDTPPENPELFRNPEITLPYIKLYLWTIPELLVISSISSETPNNIRTPTHIPVSCLLYTSPSPRDGLLS